MTTKNKIIGVIALVLVSAAVGRYTAPEKIKIVTQTTQTDTSQTDDNKDNSSHKETKTHEITHPDGTKEIITDTTEDHDSKDDSQKETSDSKTSVTDKEITKSSSHLTLSALAGVQVQSPTSGSPLIYGAHITRDILGPINMGVWGMTNRTVGLSVGLTF